MSTLTVTTEPSPGGLFGPTHPTRPIDQAILDRAVLTSFERIEDGVERVRFIREDSEAFRRAAIRQAEDERRHTTPRA